MINMLCKLLKCLSDVIRYTTAGIVIILLIPLSFIVFFLMALCSAMKKSYNECYRMIYEMLKLILGRQKVKTVILKEGQGYDETYGVYNTTEEVCEVCNNIECKCKESE